MTVTAETDPNACPCILLVDDDPEIRRLVTDYLAEHGVKALAVADGAALRRALDAERVDLVVLDVMLPGEDGLSLCRWLRAERGLPIILLTALAEEPDRVLGLEMGADDYLTKPFSARELLARIRAVLRRARDVLPVHRVRPGERYRFNGWLLDAGRRELSNPDGVRISLTAGEFDLLLAFLRHPGTVLDRDRLLALTHGRSAQAFDRAVDVQLSRLRKKLRDPDLIKTVRGGGYQLSADVRHG